MMYGKGVLLVVVMGMIFAGCGSMIPEHESATSKKPKKMSFQEQDNAYLKRRMARDHNVQDLIMSKKKRYARRVASRKVEKYEVLPEVDRDQFPFVGKWRPASAGEDMLIFKKDGTLELYDARDLSKPAETGTYKAKGFDRVEIMIKGIIETYPLRRVGGMVHLPKLGTFSPPIDIDFNRQYTKPDQVATFCVEAGPYQLQQLYSYLSENAKDNLLSTGIRDGRELKIHHKFTPSLARRLYENYKVDEMKVLKEKEKYRSYHFKLKQVSSGKQMTKKISLVKEKGKWRCNRFAYGFLKYLATNRRNDPPVWFKNLSENKTRMPMISNYSGEAISVRGSYLKFKGPYTVLINFASRIMGNNSELEGALIPRYSVADKVFFEFSGRKGDKVTRKKIIKFYTKGFRDYYFKLEGKTYGFRDTQGNARKKYEKPLPKEKYSEKKMKQRLRGFQGFLKKSVHDIKNEAPEADRIIRDGRAKGIIR